MGLDQQAQNLYKPLWECVYMSVFEFIWVYSVCVHRRFFLNVNVCAHCGASIWSDNVAYQTCGDLDQYASQVRDQTYLCVYASVSVYTGACALACLCVCWSIYLIVPVAVLAEKQQCRIYLRGSRQGDVLSVAAHTNTHMQTHAYILMLFFLFVCLSACII